MLYRLGAGESARRERNAIVLDMRVFKRVEQFVAVRGVNRNDDFGYLLELQEWFDCFGNDARVFARREKFVFRTVSLRRAACGYDDVDFHIFIPQIRGSSSTKVGRVVL